MLMSQASIGVFDLDSAALFLDVDGTLLDYASSPQLVNVPDGLVSTLGSLEDALDGALALVSGRTLGDLDRLFRPMRFRAGAVHGAEMRFDPDSDATITEKAEALPDELWQKLGVVLTDFPGVVAENKLFSFTIHYRAAPTLETRLRESLLQFAANESRHDLLMMEAHLAFELKPRGFDKGTAIRRFMIREPFIGRRPVFVGDDATDDYGFAAVAGMRGLAYSVFRLRPKTIDCFSSPSMVRQWLKNLLASQDQK
jgi:trehalose 6-phosphate phosphatase